MSSDTSSTADAFPWKALWTCVGVVLFLAALAALLLPQMCSARETARGNTCRNNLRASARAVCNYSERHGAYPGYMNVLEREDGRAVRDPTLSDSTAPVPVSWVVLILPDLDQKGLYDRYVGRETPPSRVVPQATEEPTIGRDFYVNRYLEQLLCPSDPQQSRSGTPISFVVNSGLPDGPTAPRDARANGMFFDHFTEHPLVRTNEAERGPRVTMTDEQVVDPKYKTILLTENIDAGSYTFHAATHAADGWRAVEMQTGCIWMPGSISTSAGRTPVMPPLVPSLQPNVAAGKGIGTSYDYCRPSSRHPQMVNVAFVGQNVSAMRDTISYFVYAKLMASDDARVEAAEPIFRSYDLTDSDVNP